MFNYVQLKAESVITHKFLDRRSRTKDNAPRKSAITALYLPRNFN